MIRFLYDLDIFSTPGATEEQEREISKLKVLVIFLLGMAMSGYYSWNEFRFAFFTTVYDGIIEEVYEYSPVKTDPLKSKNSFKMKNVTYSYKINGFKKTASQKLSFESNYKVGQNIKVLYLGEEYLDNSRIHGEWNPVPIMIFMFFAGAVILILIWIAVQSKASYA